MTISNLLKNVGLFLLLFISPNTFGQGFYEEIIRYKDKSIKSIITYNENDIKDGPTTHYYLNGNVKNYIPYSNGKINGVIENYYDDGILESTGLVLNDIAVGTFEFYHHNGRLKSIIFYNQGKLTSISSCKDKNGNLLYCGPFNNGNGEIYIYDEKGVLIAKDHFKNGEFIKREIIK